MILLARGRVIDISGCHDQLLHGLQVRQDFFFCNKIKKYTHYSSLLKYGNALKYTIRNLRFRLQC